jgi:hypothetical protein
MKYNKFSQIILLIIFNLLGNYASSQVFKIRKSQSSDSIYYYSDLISVIFKEKPKFTCFYENDDIRFLNSNHVDLYLDSTYNKVKRKHRINKFLGMPQTVVINEEIFVNKERVGILTINVAEYTKYVNISITKMGLSQKQFSKIKFDIQQIYPSTFKSFVEVNLKEDYTEEIAKFNAIEKKRLNDFYDYVYFSLNCPLKEIEGIYKSIDQGEKYNYDLAILKSNSQHNVFEAFVIQTTDKEIQVGRVLFNLTETATSDKYFMEYNSKAGEIFENKLAEFHGGVLRSGIKSFVKMFPSKETTKNYSKINPLVDWDASGSGVLLNNGGYIATNNHVINLAKRITVKIKSSDGNDFEFEAKIIVQNDRDDISIIKIIDSTFNRKTLGIKPVNLSKNILLGQEVFTLGFPNPAKQGENVKLNKGIISAY